VALDERVAAGDESRPAVSARAITAAMGQPVTVIEKKSATPGVVRFEINRSITGMSRALPVTDAAFGETPTAELARRLFDHGGVAGITINSNMITVDLEPGGSTAGMKTLIEELFLYYREGVEVVVPKASATRRAPHASDGQTAPARRPRLRHRR
jgi:hypothetical protein